MNRLLGVIIITALIFCGCKESNNTPTKGAVTIEVDEAVFPIIHSEVVAFDSLYKQAKVELKTTTPLDGMINLINNKSKMFVSTRYFSKKQSDYIDSQKMDIKIFKFCYNAIAVISSKSNRTENIRVDEIKDVLLGKDMQYTFVLPQNSSGTFQYIKEEILDGLDPKNAQYAVNDEEVIKKVVSTNNLIGFVSFNTIQDSSKIKFIKVGQIQKTLDKDENKNININYVNPHPGYVLNGFYPLKQIVYIYLYDISIGPASGFTTFLTSYEGQKIVLGENLAPAAVPVKINDYH